MRSKRTRCHMRLVVIGLLSLLVFDLGAAPPSSPDAKRAPETKKASKKPVDLEAAIFAWLKKSGTIGTADFTVHVRRVEGKKLIEPVFLRKKADGYDLVARAKE